MDKQYRKELELASQLVALKENIEHIEKKTKKRLDKDVYDEFFKVSFKWAKKRTDKIWEGLEIKSQHLHEQVGSVFGEIKGLSGQEEQLAKKSIKQEKGSIVL